MWFGFHSNQSGHGVLGIGSLRGFPCWPTSSIDDLAGIDLAGWVFPRRVLLTKSDAKQNSALLLGQIRNYALQRLALWLSKRGHRRRAWGWGMTPMPLT